MLGALAVGRVGSFGSWAGHAYVYRDGDGVGPVGIVQSVTGTLRDLRGNILELSQTVMRGYFTIILAVEFDAERGDRRP